MQVVSRNGVIIAIGHGKFDVALGDEVFDISLDKIPANVFTDYTVVAGELVKRATVLENWQARANAAACLQARNILLQKLILARLVAQETGEDVKPINDEIARLLAKSQAETAPKAPA